MANGKWADKITIFNLGGGTLHGICASLNSVLAQMVYIVNTPLTETIKIIMNCDQTNTHNTWLFYGVNLWDVPGFVF